MNETDKPEALVTVSLRISADEHDQLRTAAKRRGESRQRLMRRWVARGLREESKRS